MRTQKLGMPITDKMICIYYYVCLICFRKVVLQDVCGDAECHPFVRSADISTALFELQLPEGPGPADARLDMSKF